MSKDAATIKQGEIPILRKSRRLDKTAQVVRVKRTVRGGGKGNIESRPYGWGVEVIVDGKPRRLMSDRGIRREWTDLDRLEAWLREMGFRQWCVRNEVD